MKLEIHHLSVRYGTKVALSNIDLVIKPGQVVALVGPNGAGKSTMIRAISGILPVHSGKITYGNRDLLKINHAARARVLAVVPQARQLGGAFSVEQTVMLGRTAYMNWLGNATEEDKEVVHWAMSQTGISELAMRRNAELSGGEQQRVLLARALAQKTPVLLLDEPTNHLDLQHQNNFLSLVLELTKKQNLAVLMAMHDLNQVSTYADYIVLLKKGSILSLGSPKDVLTIDTIESAYQTRVEIIYHPQYETPLILPKRSS